MKNLAEMTVEELQAESKAAWGLYMYEECAERGYDFKASRAAMDRHLAAEKELAARGVLQEN